MTFFSEEELQAAVKEVSLALVRGLPEPEECQHVFSSGFERKMACLLRRNRHPTLSRVLRSAACFFLAVVICGIVWLTVDVEAREAFFGWVSEWTEGARHYFFQGSSPEDSASIRYVFPEIPDGYTFYDLERHDGLTCYCFLNSKGRLFCFEYQTGENWEMYLLTTTGEKHTVKVNGHDAEFFPADSPEHSNSLVWTEEETGALLTVDGFFEEDYLIHWAEGVRREEVDARATKYALSELPEGYRKDDVLETGQFTIIVYVDDITNHFLKLGYLIGEEKVFPTDSPVGMYFETEGMVKTSVAVNGQSADLYIDDAGEIGNLIVWQDAERDILLYISGYFDGDTLIRMAETVVRFDDPLWRVADETEVEEAELSDDPYQYAFTGETVSVSDGTELEIWRGPGGQSYRLKDGTDILDVKEPEWFKNLNGKGQEVLLALDPEVQEKIQAYIASQTLLYDVDEELEWACRVFRKEKKIDPDWVWTLGKRIVPGISNQRIISFAISAYGSSDHEGKDKGERGDVFDRETGEHLDNLDLFKCPREEVLGRLLDHMYSNLNDIEVPQSELEAAFRSEYILLGAEDLEIVFPSGTLPSVAYGYSLGLGYEMVEDLLYDWALPEQSGRR